MNRISASFESSFMSVDIERQISICDEYELAPLFLKLFSNENPVLEAGCGSGKWCAWLNSKGIKCDGVDWSEDLCAYARAKINGSDFIACDMKDTSFENSTYGGVLALGSIEHSIEGPLAILNEFNRILMPGGYAVVTVPYGGRLRLVSRFLAKPIEALKDSRLVRKLFGKDNGNNSLASAKKDCQMKWHPRFSRDKTGWFFYEYEFNKIQMREFINKAGFEVVREFVCFGDEGILHNFGRMAGKWDPSQQKVKFNLLGTVLRWVIPLKFMGHMLCYVLRTPRI